MSFSGDIKRFAAKAEKAALFVFRGTALDLFSKIVLRTPVGNPSIWKAGKATPGYTGGSLRANWQVRLNRPASGEVSGTDKSGGSTIAKGQPTINRAKGGDAIYVTNNLPYAGPVENGHSTQAPTGMVKVTIREFNRAIKKRARKA